MLSNRERTLNYARQIGVSTVGATKNRTALDRLAARLTPRQQRRLRKNARREA